MTPARIEARCRNLQKSRAERRLTVQRCQRILFYFIRSRNLTENTWKSDKKCEFRTAFSMKLQRVLQYSQ